MPLVGALTGVTLVQQFYYRGDPTEEFSNTYHFRDAPPSTSADWDTLVSGLAQATKVIYPAGVKIVRAYGYDTDDDKPVSVYSKDWLLEGNPIAGTFSPQAGSHQMAGDQAAMVAWTVDAKSSTGKWIYLRKYIHGGYMSPTQPDDIETSWQTVLTNWALVLGTPAGGFHGGLRSRKRTQPIKDSWAQQHVTTRTLHRRGKRPLAKA